MKKKNTTRQRVLVSLPNKTATRLNKYAKACKQGNKSGFVTDAIEAYISDLQKQRRVQKLRDSYAASAQHSREIAEDWQVSDEEVWKKLDELEK